MPIKNYTTDVPVDRTISDLQKILLKAKAKSIMTRFDDNQNASGVSFVVKAWERDIHFQLPVNVAGVQKSLHNDGEKNDLAHASRVAWRILKDWVDAQLALVQSGQAELQQVFLPYAENDDGTTFYQSVDNRNILALAHHKNVEE